MTDQEQAQSPKPQESLPVESKPINAGPAQPNLLEQALGFDYRGIAAMRILTGIGLILNVVLRIPEIHCFYSDEGVLPRYALMSLMDHPWRYSLYEMTGAWEVVAVLFAIQVVFGAMVMVGFRTNLATIASFIMALSLQNRNPMIVDGADIVLDFLMIWGFFMAWGNYVSIDAYGKPKPKRKIVFNMGTIGLCVQVICLYVFTAINKDGPEWRIDGMAGMYALNIDFCTTPLGVWLANFPDLVKPAALFSLYLELYGVALLVMPFGNGILKTIGVLLFALFHIGVAMTFILGLFPYNDIVALVPFLPSPVWDWVAQGKRWRIVHIIRQFMAGLAKRLAPPVVELPQGFVSARKFILNATAAAFIAFIITWNLSTIPNATIKMPPVAQDLAAFFRIDQYWVMFNKFIPQLNGYYVMPAHLADGREIDVWTGKKVSWERPPLVSATYGPNEQWNTYMVRIWAHNNLTLRRYFADYLCREWNKNHEPDEQITDFKIFLMYEGPFPETNPLDRANPEKVFVWEHRCQ